MPEEIKVEKKKTEREKQDEKSSRELSVRRENPFSLFQEMDRLFDDLSSNFWNDMKWPFSRRTYRPLSLVIRENEPVYRTPLANISETDDAFSITAELPGIDKGDLELTFQDGMLEIKGEHSEERKEEQEGQLVRREYRSAKYYRAFNLPENIDDEKIEANLDKGILRINIPKIEPVEPEKKKIEIK